MTIKLYDPALSPLVIGTRLIKGFTDGTGIKVGRSNVSMELHTGMDGEQAVTRSNNRSGFIEITLQAGSDANDFLSALMTQHEELGTGFVPATLKDLQGTTICRGSDCFVEKPADVERATKYGDTTWRIIVPKLAMNPGGLTSVA